MSLIIPESNIPSNPYLPHFDAPVYREYTLDDFSIESGQNINRSNLVFLDTGIYPFIDFSNFDNETRDWKYYRDDGFPYRLKYNTNINEYIFTNIYYPNMSSISIDSISHQYDDKEMCLKSTVDTYTFYKYVPFIVRINDILAQDISDYNTFRKDIQFNNDSDFQFFFDFEGRLYFNKNLQSFNPDTVKIGLHTVNSKISIKCLMSNNLGTSSQITPIVDNYIVKMTGQYYGRQ